MNCLVRLLNFSLMLMLFAFPFRGKAQPASEIALRLDGKWRIAFGIYASNKDALLPDYSDSNWIEASVPAFWNDYEFARGFSGLALYRKTFFVPEVARAKALYLLLGRINSVDETYLNGRLIGKTGTVQAPADGELRAYLLPDSLLEYGKLNTLAVRVFCNNLDGGIYAGVGKEKNLIGVFTKTAMRAALGQPAKPAPDSIAKIIRRTVEVMDTMLISRQPEAYMSLVSERYFNNGTRYAEQKLFAQTITQRLAGASITYHDFQVYEVSPTLVIADYDSELKWENKSSYLGHDERYFQLEHGKWLEIGNQSRFFDLEINSAYMRQKVPVSVYLPPSFLNSPRRAYPVLYLLHPQGGSHMLWRELELDRFLDSLIYQKKIVEMIVIMPSECSSYYVNSADGKRAYANFFLEELPDLVEEDYRVIRKRAARGIAGVSWGGTAAMFLALKEERGQKLFSAVGSLMGMLNYTPSARLALDGGDSTFWRPYMTTTLLGQVPDSALNNTDFFMLIGAQDMFRAGNELAAQTLRRRNIKHTFLIRRGTHSFSFWTAHLAELFRFHSEVFQRRLKKP